MAHVVFFNLAQAGHINPTLPLVAELRARGVKVTYFVDEGLKEVCEAAGAVWRYFQPTEKATEQQLSKYGANAEDQSREFPVSTLAVAADTLPAIIQELRDLEPAPSVVVYDTVVPHAMVAARVLKIPYLSMFTMPGPGVLVRPDSVTCEWETSEVTRQAREEILAAYEVDVLERGGLMEFYSPHGNLCTTVGPLFVPVASAMQKQRFDGFPWHCVGPLLPKDQPSRRRRVAHPLATAEDLPVEALAGGRPVVLLSLGTVATGFFWANRFGKQGSQNGLAEVEGRDFVRFVFRVAFEALAQEDILVVLVTGPQDDALEGMEDAPSNFVLRRAVQQLEVLPKCQAFITHGGANSVHEALSLGLPLAVVPMFGDQPVNAEKVAAVGAGISFFEPLKTLTPESLRRAVSQLLAKSSPFRSAAEDLQRQMAKAPGVKGAVDIILDAGKGERPGAAAAAAASLSAGLGGA